MVAMADLHAQVCAWENLWEAYHSASCGKRGRPAAAGFELYLADHLLALQRELEEHSYRPGAYRSFFIHERKRRLISAAPFRDRVVHHALCQATVPYFERLFDRDSYANRAHKGTHKALDRCQQLARRYRYVLPCDVVQFFPSIDHVVLRQTLARMLPDESVFWLIDRILESGRDVLSEEYQMVYFPGDDLLAAARPRGLPIGNLTSQWWANCYLNPLDQFVRRELGCRGYVRYVDDLLLFADSKAELWEWRAGLVERLARLRLTLHSGSLHPRPVTEGIPFLGFIVYPDHRRLKSRVGLAYRRRLRALVEEGSGEAVKASVQGWINHVRYADTWGLRRAVLRDCGLLAQAEHG